MRNESLIPAQAPGSAEGHAYSWRDAGLPAGHDYWHRLSGVEQSGDGRVLGVVSGMAGSPPGQPRLWLPVLTGR